MEKIDFGYAFAEPHFLTLSRPSASEKTVCAVDKQGLKFLYMYESLKDKYPLSWKMVPFDVETYLMISVNGKNSLFDRWRREKGGIPMLVADGKNENVNYEVNAIAAKNGVIVKIIFENDGAESGKTFVSLHHLNGWVISNKGWIDEINTNVLLTMNQGRADRFIAVAYGADGYPIYKKEERAKDGCVPYSNEKAGLREDSMKKITMEFALASKERKTGYIYLPYEEYFENLEKIDRIDFESEMADSIKEWKKHLNKSAKFVVGDGDLIEVVDSCIADIFVMREKIGKKYSGITCGTSHYRSANSGEPLYAEMAIDQLGYGKEAVKDYKMYLDVEEPDGCWISRKGWEHEGWGCCYNKALAVMTHYNISRDLSFLEKYYAKMKDSTMFNHRCRQLTKNSETKALRGLMIRGMGDSGQMFYSDFYGVFYPTNFNCLTADRLTAEVAKILGKEKDYREITKICDEAEKDLLVSVRDNPIKEDGYIRIANVANAPSTSIYECFNGYFPAGVLSKDDPLISGTVRYVKSKGLSEGGLPVGTGWLKDGVWAGMALFIFSRTYLRMGMYEDAIGFLYKVINHATPFVTWCEERGAEKNSSLKTGDMQHLWTPLAIVMYMIDAMCFTHEEKVHLFAGADKEWFLKGKVGFKNLRTAYGKTSAFVKVGKTVEFSLRSQYVIDKPIVVHYYLNGGKKTKEIKPEGKSVNLTWSE